MSNSTPPPLPGTPPPLAPQPKPTKSNNPGAPRSPRLVLAAIILVIGLAIAVASGGIAGFVIGAVSILIAIGILGGDIKSQKKLLNDLTRDVSALAEKVRRLEKYQGIVDAEPELARMRKDAADTLAKAQTDAGNLKREAETASKTITETATSESEKIKAEAKTSANSMREEARKKLEAAEQKALAIEQTARRDAAATVSRAEKHAGEIAGDAYRALREKDEIARVASAMRNIIEGYGDKYLVPSHGLIDDLADDFGHVEAGERLKEARKKTRELMEKNAAATCDYVELNRRMMAVRFILDAFNGKVDTALSEAKHDNYGTLEQQILDAYAVVNNEGAAFRNARILPEYRDARMDELRWAVRAFLLREQEREEQRRIKEQMREEERARREYERAIKQAEKDENTLREAMEKARQEIEHANGQERKKYEEQISQLSEKLAQAEANSQRAKSMAEQTKAGHVYIISNIGSFGIDVFKIGMTRRLDPMDRVYELGDAAVPFDFDVHAMIYSEDAPAMENMLHDRFAGHRVNMVNMRKEFFRMPIKAICAELEAAGCRVNVTMVAEAHEYRETLKIIELGKAENSRSLVPSPA